MDSSSALGFLLILLSIFAYFIPSIIASNRKHPNKAAIFLTNLLLGWTFLGWVAALIWSCTNPKPQQVVVQAPQDPAAAVADDPGDTKECPYCAETIKAAAIVCRFCGHELEPS